MSKEMLVKWGMNALVAILFGCIPLGLFLAFWFNDPHWLWLCGTLLIFLS